MSRNIHGWIKIARIGVPNKPGGNNLYWTYPSKYENHTNIYSDINHTFPRWKRIVRVAGKSKTSYKGAL